jgi:hypothetical protein
MTLEQLCAARDEIIMVPGLSLESQEAAYGLFTAAILELRDTTDKK